MSIQLFDSLERKLKPLQPSQADGVYRFYNCGPTVYDAAHIGNFRTFIVNDILRRLLEIEFGADKVKHVRNLTDVDDKTIKRSRDEGRPLGEVTQHWTNKFHQDCDVLNCLRPHVEPAATTHILEQVAMIETLMQKGNAYAAADGSVYFKVASFLDYGALSHIKERELKPGAALAAEDEYDKDSLSDFALWKAYKSDDGDVKWPGPVGATEGRPGWHIECSAMSKKHLGATIDLHTGGVDLLFPHHENEIAQSQCCNGTTFSRHWYHSEHLLVDGRKMSKSLGNLYTLDELVAKGFSPMAVRFTLIAAHPRKQLNFTLDSLHAAEKALGSLLAFAKILAQGKPESFDEKLLDGSLAPSALFKNVFTALHDDLNLPAALGALFTIVNRFDPTTVKLSDTVAFAQVLRAFGFKLNLTNEHAVAAIPAEIAALAEKRWAVKKNKDFAGADALRKELTAAGWSMLDGKDGYKLEPLKK